MEPKVVGPSSSTDWEKYFDLRWRVLREPWNQPRGSEKDDREEKSQHLMVVDPESRVLAVGRLHFNSSTEAQIRFMAVAPEEQGRGLGAAVLRDCERRARAAGAHSIVLNAREDVQEFYQRYGFEVIGPGPTMFKVLRHVQMRKILCANDAKAPR
jgi:predicted GNAT family N-acyltransferase